MTGMCKAPKKPDIQIPKTLGECADTLQKLREKRHKLQRQAEAIAAEEAAIKAHVIAELPTEQATGVAGKRARVQVTATTEPTAEDWQKLWKYIVKEDAYDLVQRRISPPAIRERWEAGEKIPGVGTIVVKKVSVTSL